MFFFQEFEQFRRIREFFVHHGWKYGDINIYPIVFYLIHGQLFESRVLKRGVFGICYNIVSKFCMRDDGTYASSKFTIHFQGYKTCPFLQKLFVVELDLAGVSESEFFQYGSFGELEAGGLKRIHVIALVINDGSVSYDTGFVSCSISAVQIFE